MPALQAPVDPLRHGQDLIYRTHLGTCAQLGSDDIPDDLRIEGIARDADAVVPQQIVSRALPVRPHSQEREIAGAAAEIADKNQFFVIES